MKKKPTKRRRALAGKNYSLVNRTKPSSQQILPERYTCNMHTKIVGAWIQATGNTTNYYSFAIRSATIYYPFNASYYDAQVIPYVVTTTSGFQPINATPTVANMLGAGYLQLAQLYNIYKVKSAKLSIIATPTYSTDASLLTVLPIGGTTATGGYSTPPYNVNELTTQPFSKQKIISANVQVEGKNKISMSMQSHTILGYTKQQFEDLPFTAVNAVPTALADWAFLIDLHTLDSAVYGTFATGNFISMEMELVQRVEFAGLVKMTV